MNAFNCSFYRQLSGFFLLYAFLCNLFAVMPVWCSILFYSAVSPLVSSHVLRKHMLHELCSPKSCKWKKKGVGKTCRKYNRSNEICSNLNIKFMNYIPNFQLHCIYLVTFKRFKTSDPISCPCAYHHCLNISTVFFACFLFGPVVNDFCFPALFS